MIRSNISFSDSKEPLQSNLEIYSKIISNLQNRNFQLLQENQRLKKQTSGCSKPTSFLSGSGFAETAESFQQRSCEISSLEYLKQEFIEIESLQSSMKSENILLKSKIQQFSEVASGIQKIGSLTEKLYLFFQSLVRRDDLHISILLTSGEAEKKDVEKPELLAEAVNKNKELLGKIIDLIIDLAAEDILNECCKAF